MGFSNCSTWPLFIFAPSCTILLYEASGNLMRVAKLGWFVDGAPNHRPYLENPEVLLLIPRIMHDFSIYTGIP